VHHEVYRSLVGLFAIITAAAPLPTKRVERAPPPFSGPLTGLLGGCDIHDGDMLKRLGYRHDHVKGYYDDIMTRRITQVMKEK